MSHLLYQTRIYSWFPLEQFFKGGSSVLKTKVGTTKQKNRCGKKIGAAAILN